MRCSDHVAPLTTLPHVGRLQVFSMLLRKCRSSKLLIPNLAKSKGDDSTYEGATVIEPKKAFYEDPIATLDFASLYPSIMQAYNLCYSTLISREELHKLSPGDYITTPSNEHFIKASVKKGILPLILDELLAARKRAKKDMAAATDPMVRPSWAWAEKAVTLEPAAVSRSRWRSYRRRRCRTAGSWR